MTTTVKVMTHDWPVAVTIKDEVSGGDPVFTSARVEPSSEREFHLTSSRSIMFAELPKPEEPAAPEPAGEDPNAGRASNRMGEPRAEQRLAGIANRFSVGPSNRPSCPSENSGLFLTLLRVARHGKVAVLFSGRSWLACRLTSAPSGARRSNAARPPGCRDSSNWADQFDGADGVLGAVVGAGVSASK